MLGYVFMSETPCAMCMCKSVPSSVGVCSSRQDVARYLALSRDVLRRRNPPPRYAQSSAAVVESVMLKGWPCCRAQHPLLLRLPPPNLQGGTGFCCRLAASHCSRSSLVEVCSTTSRKRTELLARNFPTTRARRTSSS